jgi:hypothetical protein
MAMNAIDTNTTNLTGPLKDEMARLNDSLQKSADAAAIAADSASSIAKTIASLSEKETALKTSLQKALDDKLLYGVDSKSFAADIKVMFNDYVQLLGLKPDKNGVYKNSDGKVITPEGIYAALEKTALKELSINGQNVYVIAAGKLLTGKDLTGSGDSTVRLPLKQQNAIKKNAAKPYEQRDPNVPNAPAKGSGGAMHNPKYKPNENLGPSTAGMLKSNIDKDYLYAGNGIVYLKDDPSQMVGQWYTTTQAGRIAYGSGGPVDGPGTGTSDSIPAYLSNGEYVVKASAVKQYGTQFFDALNAQHFKTGSKGGVKPSDYVYSASIGSKGGEWITKQQFDLQKKQINAFVGHTLLEMTGFPAGKRLLTGNSSRVGDSFLPGWAAKTLGVGSDVLMAIPLLKSLKSISTLRELSTLDQAFKDYKLLKGATHVSPDPLLEGRLLDPLKHTSNKLDSLGRGNYLSTGEPLTGFAIGGNTYKLSPLSLLKGVKGKGLITETQWKDMFGRGMYPGSFLQDSPEWQSYLKSGFTGIKKAQTNEVSLNYPVKYKTANPEDFIKPKIKINTQIDMSKYFDAAGKPKGLASGGLINISKFKNNGPAKNITKWIGNNLLGLDDLRKGMKDKSDFGAWWHGVKGGAELALTLSGINDAKLLGQLGIKGLSKLATKSAKSEITKFDGLKFVSRATEGNSKPYIMQAANGSKHYMKPITDPLEAAYEIAGSKIAKKFKIPTTDNIVGTYENMPYVLSKDFTSKGMKTLDQAFGPTTTGAINPGWIKSINSMQSFGKMKAVASILGHGDLHASNALIDSKGSIGVFDWGRLNHLYNPAETLFRDAKYYDPADYAKFVKGFSSVQKELNKVKPEKFISDVLKSTGIKDEKSLSVLTSILQRNLEYLKDFKPPIKQANGGYIMPSYKTGTPYVPFDQVAYLHQGERVVPASQNNATMGNTIYLTNNITAAPGMDTELLAMRVVDMTKKSLAADVNVNASKVGIKREFGSKVMI